MPHSRQIHPSRSYTRTWVAKGRGWRILFVMRSLLSPLRCVAFGQRAPELGKLFAQRRGFEDLDLVAPGGDPVLHLGGVGAGKAELDAAAVDGAELLLRVPATLTDEGRDLRGESQLEVHRVIADEDAEGRVLELLGLVARRCLADLAGRADRLHSLKVEDDDLVVLGHERVEV